MKRLLVPVFLTVAMFLTVAAGTMANELPIPPPPPAHPPSGETAPVPNLDVHAPIAPVSDEPRVDVRMFRARSYDPSLGFAPGSRYQSSEDRKAIQTPGFSINVPLR